MTKKKQDLLVYYKSLKPYVEQKTTRNMADKIFKTWQEYKMPLLVASTGAGKTYASIAAADEIDHRALIIVIGPKMKISDHSWEGSVYQYNKSMQTDLTITTSTIDKITSLKTNLELNKKIQAAKNGKRKVILVYDEAHKVMTVFPKISKRAKALFDLSKHPQVDRMLGITATPVGNSYLDEVAPLIINGFYRTKTDFSNQHIRFWDDHFQPVVKNRQGEIDPDLFNDHELIEQRFHAIQVYVDTENLKPKVYKHDVVIEFDDKIPRHFPMYDEFKLPKKLYTEKEAYRLNRKLYKLGYWNSATQRTNVAAKITAMSLQKMRTLSKIIYQNYHSKEPHPILLFYRLDFERDAVKAYVRMNKNKLYPELEIRYINGQKNELSIVNEGKNPHMLVLIQYNSGAEGIEIPNAYTSVFYGATYSQKTYQQAKGRNVRAFKSHPIAHYRLIIQNSYDEKVWSLIDSKKQFSESQLRKLVEQEE